LAASVQSAESAAMRPAFSVSALKDAILFDIDVPRSVSPHPGDTAHKLDLSADHG
jgi:hypothetical protein